MATAEAFHTTPVDVRQWPNPVFLDAIEYLGLKDAYQDRYDEWVKATNVNGN